MVLIYTFPTESYHPEDLPDPILDDIEIQGPPLQMQKDRLEDAKLKVVVNGPQLTNLRARITLTRLQSIDNAQPPSSDWSVTTLPTGTPKFEAQWECVDPSHTVDPQHQPTFVAPFLPSTAGTFRFTYWVDADELATPVETYLDVTVTP